ncbi:MAG: hypothetical protein ABIQ18_11160, partial [Umezawaea sp.]
SAGADGGLPQPNVGVLSQTRALTGTMEVWLEPVLDGTLLHYFLRAELPDGVSDKRVRREIRRRQLAAKEVSLGLKMTLEAGRAPGCPPLVS